MERVEVSKALGGVMISISPKKIIRFFILVIVSITLANIVIQYSKFFLGYDSLLGLSRLLNVDNENAIPSWYSSITLLICSTLLALIFAIKKQQNDRYTNHWKGLSIIFLYLSLDEAASIHEILIEPLRHSLKLSGFLYFPWVIAALILVLIVAITYWKFLFSLPTKIRWLFMIAAAIYVIGAVGMEMVGGAFLSTNLASVSMEKSTGWHGMGFQLILAVEELLEMIGIGVFLYALMRYISANIKDIQIRVSDRKSI